MSRYLVDKFLYRVDRDAEALERYARDPAGFVAWWEEHEAPRLGDVERTSAHRFTEDERNALARHDYEALYRMGAHPFLLWTLALPVLQGETLEFDEVARSYRKRIKPHGRPNFTT